MRWRRERVILNDVRRVPIDRDRNHLLVTNTKYRIGRTEAVDNVREQERAMVAKCLLKQSLAVLTNPVPSFYRQSIHSSSAEHTWESIPTSLSLVPSFARW